MRTNNLNLRHLRAFREVAEHKSVSVAASHVHLSQPAITQALSKLETLLEVRLFNRQSGGMFLTEPGTIYLRRVNRALNLIEDGARAAIRAGKKNGNSSARFDHLITTAQLNSLLAVAEVGNFSLAARAIDISQPSLHRTARDLERIAGVTFFNRVRQGIEMTASAKVLAQYVRLAFSELEQGAQEIKFWRGFDSGHIVIGTMPLARTTILPQSINALLKAKPDVDVSVIDGPYDDLLHGLRHGEIDLLIGALRDPLPISDVVQESLFSDPLAIVSRCGHPLSDQDDVCLKDLSAYPWAVPRADTPTRHFFESLFATADVEKPKHVIETSSLVLIRGLLQGSDRLTIMSAHQMRHEEEQGLLQRLNVDMSATSRNIGITLRKDWQPTATQSFFLDLLRSSGKQIAG